MDSKHPHLEKAGDVDRQTRLAQLRQFVMDGSLTNEEHRYVKILLSRVNIDIISELPIELVAQIADFLGLRDFVTCLAVSRRWRGKFLSIINAVTDELCPSLRHISMGTPLDPNECLKTLHRIGRLHRHFFESSLEKSFSWQNESYFKLDPEYHGRHKDMSAAYAQFDCQPDLEPDSSAYENALYSHGRIAWQPWPRIIVVDNLWSRTRKVFTSPKGPLVHPECKLQALGDRLVIASMDRLLTAWDHIANICLEKKLPGSIRYVATRGSEVAIILFSGDVFLWEFGGKFSTLATTPLINYHGFTNELTKDWKQNLCVIFHPTCTRKLFLASGYTDSSGSKLTLKRMVYEFDDTSHTETFESEISMGKKVRTTQVRIGKGMPCHRDIIGFVEVYLFADPPIPVAASESFVEFDIYKRKFFERTNERGFPHINWVMGHKHGDVDFLIQFHDRGFTAYSFQPGFDLKIGE
ncbi:uncharacterized protein F4807DRAFT_241622 [Annulohypoxylon truncatum]|uniref:uncharacterized protein n=1 Tax=Annulohypoxylon truncatum TaxID=327061 RepID=UPI002008CBFE|nr:uncharacterized protein F4807DRAFT_241622 [Annulohypoxylon truncatum]KAI1206220.1 hypothetical protein F4807DRAFT_241622 [Annulohypoxylon truncatum]